MKTKRWMEAALAASLQPQPPMPWARRVTPASQAPATAANHIPQQACA